MTTLRTLRTRTAKLARRADKLCRIASRKDSTVAQRKAARTAQSMWYQSNLATRKAFANATANANARFIAR